jgi:myosin-5
MYTKCWFSSKIHGWELGNFKDLRNGTVEVEGSEGAKIFSNADIHRYDPSHELDHDDMCSMNHLHEAPLLDNLRRRFLIDKIYTTTGDVLISVNPYKRIAGLYDNIAAYLDIAEDGEVDRSATMPHVYKIANDALMEMMYGKRSLHENATAAESICSN